MKHIHLDDIIGTVSIFGILISFFVLIGTAGAIDCDDLALSDGIRRGSIWLVILICSVIGIVHVEKEEDIYDKL